MARLGAVPAAVWALALCAIAPAARAAIVRIDFAGTVTTVDNIGSLNDGSVVVGAPLTGFVLFDTNAPAESYDETEINALGFYRSAGPPSALSASVGNYSNSEAAVLIVVNDYHPPADPLFRDYVNFNSDTTFPGANELTYRNFSFQFGFFGTGQTLVSTAVLSEIPWGRLDDLPTSPWAGMRMQSFENDFLVGEVDVQFAIDSFSVVPEASSFALIGLALGMAAAARARR